VILKCFGGQDGQIRLFNDDSSTAAIIYPQQYEIMIAFSDLKGRIMVYLKVIFWNLSGRTEKKTRKTSGQLLSQLRLELGTSKIQKCCHL
jgi:hypothetical protein